jgi:hypothetical protein
MKGLKRIINEGDYDRFEKYQDSAVYEALSGKPSYDVSPEATAKYFEQAVAAPALAKYDEEIAPRIKEAYASRGGYFSSRRSLAQQQALGDLSSNLTAQLAQAQMGNQQLAAQLAENARGRQLQGVQLADYMAAAPARYSQYMTQALAPFQAEKEAGIAANIQRFQTSQPYNNPWLERALQYISQSQTYTYWPKPSPVYGMAAGALAGVASGYGQDRADARNQQLMSMLGGQQQQLQQGGGGASPAQGAAGGAASGAAMGTAVSPGLGTIIGALIGGGVGYFSSR